MTALEIAFWVSAGPDRLHACRLSAAAARACAHARARTGLPAGATCRAVSLIVAAHDEAGRDRAQGAQRARARLPAREARGDRRIRRLRGRHRREPRARPPAGRTRVRVLDLAAARQGARAGRRGRRGDAGRCWRSRTRTRSGSPARSRALVRPFADPRVGYVCGCLAYLAPDGSNQEGAYWRYENAVRVLESRLASVTAGQRRDLCRAARGLPAPRPAHQPRPVVPLQPRQARVARRVRAGGARGRAAGGDDRGRVPAQAAHDEPRLAGGARRRDARPARLRAVYALEIFSHRALRYATPFLHVVALGANVALLGRGMGLRRDACGAAGVAAGRCARAGSPRPPALLALCRYYVLMTASLAAGPLGLGAPRHAGDLGAGGRARVSRGSRRPAPARRARREARARRRARPRCCWCCASPLLALACVAIRLESRGSPIYRQRRVGKRGGASSTC